MSEEMIAISGEYSDIIPIIDGARYRAQKAVNTEMIQMYWDIGRYVSERVNDGGWGKSVVQEFSAFLQSHYPSAKGFSAQNIWRMKQFYETYTGNEKLSPLVRELSWTNNLAILSGCVSATTIPSASWNVRSAAFCSSERCCPMSATKICSRRTKASRRCGMRMYLSSSICRNPSKKRIFARASSRT